VVAVLNYGKHNNFVQQINGGEYPQIFEYKNFTIYQALCAMFCAEQERSGAKMECPECKKELEIHDTTYSNISTYRSTIGQHTGDIYKCEDCEHYWIDNKLNGKVEPWSY